MLSLYEMRRPAFLSECLARNTYQATGAGSWKVQPFLICLSDEWNYLNGTRP